MNYLLILTSLCVLACLAYGEVTSRGAGNIILLALAAESLLLVQGQALYILIGLAGNPHVLYPGPEPKLISHTGFTLANVCVTLSLLVLALTYILLRASQPAPASHVALRPEIETAPSYIVVSGIVMLGVAGLMVLFGGFRHLLHNPGTMVGGQTLLLIVLFSGKMPFLHKIAYRRRLNWLDGGLFLVTLFFLVINSRLLALIAVAQYAILQHYRSGSHRLGRRAIVASLAAFLIVFVYGTLRNFADMFHTYDLHLLRLYYASPAAPAMGPLALLYEHGESAFSGLAGILSVYCAHGVSYDFGASNLKFFLHLIPNAARSGVLTGLQRWISTVYPYHGSVLPGGYEAAFAHFGFLGVLCFSIALGWIPAALHRRLIDPNTDGLPYGLVAAHALTLFILDWWGVAFFLLADLAVLYSYKLTLLVFQPLPVEVVLTDSPRQAAAGTCE